MSMGGQGVMSKMDRNSYPYIGKLLHYIDYSLPRKQ